jgi:hypothetical protein
MASKDPLTPEIPFDSAAHLAAVKDITSYLDRKDKEKEMQFKEHHVSDGALTLGFVLTKKKNFLHSDERQNFLFIKRCILFPVKTIA